MKEKPLKIGHIRIKLGQLCLKLGQKCLKTGQYYITLNNPRELLLQIKELKDKIYTLENPAEQLLRLNGFLKEFDEIVAERDRYKEKLNKILYIVEHDSDYDSDAFEGREFQNDILDILEGDERD